MTTDVAIIGDRFLRSSMIQSALEEACGASVRCKSLDLPWPDEPLHQCPHATELANLREYMGTPEQVLAHLGSAPALVTQLAPISASVFEQADQLRFPGNCTERTRQCRPGCCITARRSSNQRARPKRIRRG